MRVVYLSQHFAPDVAAAAQMVSDLGAALTAAGHDGTAISCDRSYVDPSTRYPLRETLRGMQIERVRSTGFGRARKIGRMADYATFLLGATRRLLFGKKPDVVISLSSPPMMALVGTLGARLRGARSIFWSMDVYPDVAFELGVIRRGGLVGRFFSFLAWVSLRTPDVVVALGDTMAARLTALGARNVEVIHNWAPVESNAAPTNAGRMPSWGDDCVLMYSGNLGLAHEFETMLVAASSVGSRVRFVFVGGGPRLGEVKARVDELGLTNVEFHPYVSLDAVAASLGAPNVHLVSMRDGLQGLLVPSKIYGILGAGRAALYVGPAEGEIHDIVTAGGCGVSLRIGDVDGLVDAIRRYRDEPTLAGEHGRRARLFYDENFAREKSLGKFVRLVERVAAT